MEEKKIRFFEDEEKKEVTEEEAAQREKKERFQSFMRLMDDDGPPGAHGRFTFAFRPKLLSNDSSEPNSGVSTRRTHYKKFK